MSVLLDLFCSFFLRTQKPFTTGKCKRYAIKQKRTWESKNFFHVANQLKVLVIPSVIVLTYFIEVKDLSKDPLIYFSLKNQILIILSLSCFISQRTVFLLLCCTDFTFIPVDM